MRVESLTWKFALSCLTFPLASPRRGIIGSYSNSVFGFWKELSLFQSDSTVFHSYHQCTRVPVSLHTAYAYYFPLFFFFFFSNSHSSGREVVFCSLLYYHNEYCQNVPCTHARDMPAPCIIYSLSRAVCTSLYTLHPTANLRHCQRQSQMHNCLYVSFHWKRGNRRLAARVGSLLLCHCQAEGV